jgi:hypothetical protein
MNQATSCSPHQVGEYKKKGANTAAATGTNAQNTDATRCCRQRDPVAERQAPVRSWQVLTLLALLGTLLALQAPVRSWQVLTLLALLVQKCTY